MDDRPAAIDSEAQTIDNESQLRGLYQEPMELALLKQLDRLDDHCRNFIAHSPFVVIGSTRPGRGTDVSPRGMRPALPACSTPTPSPFRTGPATTGSTRCRTS